MTRLLLIASLILFTNCGDSDDDKTTTDDLSVPEFSVKPLKGTGIPEDVSSDLLAASDGVSCADQEDFYESHGAIAAADLTDFNDASDNNPEVFVTSIYAVAMHFDCMVRAMFDDATPDSTGDVVEYSDESGDNDYFVAWNKDASTNVTDGRLVVTMVDKKNSGDVTTKIVVTLSHDATNDTKTIKGAMSKQVGTGTKTWSGAYVHAFEDADGVMNHYAGVRIFDGTNISLAGAHMIKEKGASMFTRKCAANDTDDENTACSMIDGDATNDNMRVVYFDKAGASSITEAGTGLFALDGKDLIKWLGDHVDINPLYGTAGSLFEDAATADDLFEADYSKP